MIKSFQVRGLNNKMNFYLNFNPDINLITGRNGAGKTTVLKLIWYLQSGNLERAINEIDFDYAKLVTDKIMLEITKSNEELNDEILSQLFMKRSHRAFNDNRSNKIRVDTYKINFWIDNKENSLHVIDPAQIEPVSNSIASNSESSVFFPTFRRIEGGFAIKRTNRQRYGVIDDNLDMATKEFSKRLSSKNHQFITSISTTDIVELLTEQYANNSQITNDLHIRLSEYIERKIKAYSRTNNNNDKKINEAREILNDIQFKMQDISFQREQIIKPFTTLSELIMRIFQYKGIKVTEKVTLGDVKEAMASEYLSAGEKQMLSFIVYNLFYNNSIIFIDEPEISLHVDWQRTLFPILMSQGTKNQFIVTTHSPFIYSNYADKEILLAEDRGGF